MTLLAVIFRSSAVRCVLTCQSGACAIAFNAWNTTACQDPCVFLRFKAFLRAILHPLNYPLSNGQTCVTATDTHRTLHLLRHFMPEFPATGWDCIVFTRVICCEANFFMVSSVISKESQSSQAIIHILVWIVFHISRSFCRSFTSKEMEKTDVKNWSCHHRNELSVDVVNCTD